MTVESPGNGDGSDPVLVRMRVWHPRCWNIEVSEAVDAGLLGYGLFNRDGNTGTCRLTAYGDTSADVDALVQCARESPDTYAVHELGRDVRSGHAGASPGNATRDLLVESALDTKISTAFLSRGFVYAEPIVVEDGVEEWTVLTTRDWDDVGPTLDDVRREEDADIEILSMRRATQGVGHGSLPLGCLSQRQREVFELARERGYYAHPRQVTPRELADELGVTTSTFHEHLHKAEAKLLHDPLHQD